MSTRILWLVIPCLTLAAIILLVSLRGAADHPEPLPQITLPPEPAEASADQAHMICGACHVYPPPECMPRAHWRKEIHQAFEFFRDSNLALDFPSIESLIAYYERRAPEDLPALPLQSSPGPAPIRFAPAHYSFHDRRLLPAVSNVNLAHLFDRTRLDVLVCDMRSDQILAFRPYLPSAPWKVLGPAPVPAHAEVVDLDGDGIPDILVACLGDFYPTSGLTGSVVWLRGSRDGSFTPITLLENVGRVADVQAADFNGDGKLDLVVAVFGWRTTGSILYLENQTTDWRKPHFVPHVLDNRHGTIHVPVCDLDNDGRPDFVALISQEHETVVAFLNEGGGRFRQETIYTAPHPAFGSSGIQVVDLDGDGKLDVLYTAGDTLDSTVLRPEHGIQWLQNLGRFPFEPHCLTHMHGTMRAVAADLQGKGRRDIVAVSYLPPATSDRHPELRFDSIVYLEQTEPGKFLRHSLEEGKCNHLTCALGDVYGDGRIHLVTANHFFRPTGRSESAIDLWRNLGPTRPLQPAQGASDFDRTQSPLDR